MKLIIYLECLLKQILNYDFGMDTPEKRTKLQRQIAKTHTEDGKYHPYYEFFLHIHKKIMIIHEFDEGDQFGAKLIKNGIILRMGPGETSIIIRKKINIYVSKMLGISGYGTESMMNIWRDESSIKKGRTRKAEKNE